MKFRRPKRPTPYVPTASMADIAFLLFVFFAVATSIEKDLGVKLVLPRTSKPEAMPTRPVNVSIDAEGEIYVNGKKVASKSGVKQHVQTLLDGVEPEQREIIFRCDKDITKEVFEPIIFAASEAGAVLIMSTEPSSSESGG